MKKVKKFDFFVILICFILFGYSIYVGSPVQNNTNIINLFVLIVFLVYMAYILVKNRKYKIIKRKIDIFIIILVFSSFISLIFQNYANLEATIEYIIKYTTILSLYLMVRDSILKDNKYTGYILNTLIISSVGIFILGLDDLTFKFFKSFIKITNNVEISNKDNRFLGIFGYANTTAILMLVISIISSNRYLTTSSKTKNLYSLIIFINILAIILSYSRAVWIITLIAYLIFFCIIKETKINFLELIVRIGILSAISSLFIIKFMNRKEFLYVWLILVAFLAIAFFSNMFSEKILKKVKVRYCIIAFACAVLIVIVLWNVALKITEPLVLFNNINIKEEPTCDITNVMPDTEYKFEFNISAKAEYKIDELYTIEVCERNKYDDILIKHEIKFGNFEGIKDIDFTTTPYTHKILLRFKSKHRVAQRGLVINSLKINNKEKPLKYKFLPSKIVDKVQDINLKTISVTERFSYMKNACKLIKKYGLLGIGADGWKDRQSEVQEYYNYANEVHSYILEVFCEFGIVGFVALIGIMIIIFKELLLKSKNDVNKLYILFAIIVLLIHSFMDFELSFMYILVVLFCLIATIRF